MYISQEMEIYRYIRRLIKWIYVKCNIRICRQTCVYIHVYNIHMYYMQIYVYAHVCTYVYETYMKPLLSPYLLRVGSDLSALPASTSVILTISQIWPLRSQSQEVARSVFERAHSGSISVPYLFLLEVVQSISFNGMVDLLGVSA